jgi:TolB-like protein/Flp pilus assembly protein TadD
MIGKSLAHYEILEQIGEGGMGIVYRARDSRLGREVALKLLSAPLLQQRQAALRLQREARSLASLHHPNVATLFGFEEIDGQGILVMELVRGEDLATILARGPLSPEHAREILRQIAEGLAAAHRQGLVHRDLKPANVKITPDGQAKLLDFGLALDVDDTQITQEGATLGTVAYMSPEQARGEAVDARSDLFSLGVILYQMLSGERPLSAENAAALVHRLANLSQAPTVGARLEIPEDLARVVERCLQPRREDRYPSVEELLADLEQGSSPVRRGERAGAMPQKSRLRWPVVMLLVAIGAGATGTYWFFGRERAAPQGPADDRELSTAVAVLPYENLSGDLEIDWLSRAVPELLTASMSRESDLDVISSQRAALIVEQAGHGGSELPLEAMRRAKVRSVISGSILAAGSELIIHSQLIETASGKVLHTAEARGAGTEGLFDLVASLTRAHRDYLEIRSISERIDERWIQELTTYSVDAYRAYARGREHLLRTQWNSAIDFFQEAVAIDSTFVSAWVDLSSSYWNVGDVERTERAFAKAQSLRDRASPREQIWMDLFGAVKIDDGPRTVLFANELAAREPENLFVRYLLGKGYYTSQDYAQAAEVWRPLREQRWEWIWTYLYSSRALSELGRHDEALQALAQLDEIASPGDAYARSRMHRYRGRVLAAAKRPNDADSAFASALELDPTYFEVHYDRALLFIDSGDSLRARDALRVYLRDQVGDLYLEEATALLEQLD